MSSQRRIDASRANGARSRGPVTPEGKARSAGNAIRHGLLSRTVVLDVEDSEAFVALLTSMVSRLQPADDLELSLIEDMAAAQWRQRRIWAIETRMMDNATASSAEALPVDRLTGAFETLASGNALALTHRYETRQTRMFQRALQTLMLLRKETAPIEPSPISEHPQSPCEEPEG